MWNTLKNLTKKIIPKILLNKIRPLYHGLAAIWASVVNKHPSEKLIVIGVTGTGGKSTTVNLLAFILNHSGYKTGFITTANYSFGDTVFVNKHGLSMPNEFLLQKQLRTMVEHNCKVAIIEATSEGLEQNRHYGINFDVALFTNLSPAHLDSHGNFENYRAAKGKLFSSLANHRLKPFFSKKIIGVNLDDLNADFFSKFSATEKFGVSLVTKHAEMKTFFAQNTEDESKISFELEGQTYKLSMFGKHNLYNALLAVATSLKLGVSPSQISNALAKFSGVPGRMEKIESPKGYTIYIDYAPEPKPMEASLLAVGHLPHNKIIHVFGSTGGHRDVEKRFKFGKISSKHADVIIVTNDDVYDTDPNKIAEDIISGINEVPESERKAKEVQTVLDRREALKTALHIAGKGDIVLVTGKGSEQFLVLPENKRINWDEKTIIDQLIKES